MHDLSLGIWRKGVIPADYEPRRKAQQAQCRRNHLPGDPFGNCPCLTKAMCPFLESESDDER